MRHSEQSPLAGKKLKIKDEANEIGGNEILIEDWWDRVAGISWKDANGNPAALNYAIRSGFSKNINVPMDDECVYGKIGMLGHIVHVKELEA
jgi:hypothetical protein